MAWSKNGTTKALQITGVWGNKKGSEAIHRAISTPFVGQSGFQVFLGKLPDLTWSNNLVHPIGMKAVNTHEAKTHFSRLLRRVAAGEEITIANRGVPVARLIPMPVGGAKRKLGAFTGQMTNPEDFDAPLLEEFLTAFEAKQKRRKNKG